MLPNTLTNKCISSGVKHKGKLTFWNNFFKIKIRFLNSEVKFEIYENCHSQGKFLAKRGKKCKEDMVKVVEENSARHK